MVNKKTKTKKSGTGESAGSRTAGLHRGAVVLSAVMTLLVMLAGAGCLKVQADEKVKTVVITTDSEDEFATEASKLAQKSTGLGIKSAGNEARPYSAARLIVSVKDGEKVDFSKYNAATVVESDFGVSLVQFNSSDAAEKAAEKIGKLSAVSYVEPDDCFVNIGETVVSEIGEGSDSGNEEIPSDESEDVGELGDMKIGDKTYSGEDDLIYENSLETESITISSGSVSWGTAYIQADKYAAFVKANTKRSIKVAVVDTGVSSHTRLQGRILAGKDFVENDNDASDKNGHGTHVAGIIVDCTPGINVNILPVRVMNASGEGSASIVGNGIRYAANSGAKVINLSLGSYTHYQYIEQCITYAHNKGATVVVAAGNESDNTAYVCPAHMASPIVVGAIDSSGERAFFSNYGSSLDVVAPGVDVRSCWLDGQYATASGTSMAVPHVSAAAAMYRLMNPSITPAKTEYMVRCYAKDLGAKGTDNYYGRGVPRMAGAITPSKVTVSQAKASLRVGKTLTLKATISPSYAGRKQLTWTSSNENIVTVSGGKLTAKHEGEATITVKTVNGKKATCLVTVSNSTGELLQIGPLLKNTVSGSLYKTLSLAMEVSAVDSGKKSSTASSSAKENTSSDKKSTAAATAKSSTAASDQKNNTNSAAKQGSTSTSAKAGSASSSAQTVSVASSVQTDSSAPVSSAAGTQETVKIYVYPSEESGNIPIQDGSIVTGSRLALDAEIVPAKKDAALTWQSSAPAVASVDENGVVTAVSAGEAQITAVIADADDQNGKSSDETSGTYSVKVVDPSVLTRHASYSAEDKEEVTIETVLRLPASLSDDAGDGDRINEAADYVVAILSKKGADAVLLGAVDLGGDDSGAVHVHYSGSGSKRTDITEVTGVSEEILTDVNAGKRASETGILYMRSISADGCKADISLAADIEALRALADPGDARTETLSECRIAVYTAKAFEEREEAAENGDKDTVRRIDEGAVCECGFSLSYEIPAQDTEDADAAAEADTSSQAQPQEQKDQKDQKDQKEQDSTDSGKDAEKEDSSEGGSDASAADDSASEQDAAEGGSSSEDSDTADASVAAGTSSTSGKTDADADSVSDTEQTADDSTDDDTEEAAQPVKEEQPADETDEVSEEEENSADDDVSADSTSDANAKDASSESSSAQSEEKTEESTGNGVTDSAQTVQTESADESEIQE